MDNFSQVFADTLAEYESPYVPGDQGDAGKGQVTVRAGFKINTTLDPDVGYIAKTGGQTQFHGVSVDALQDKSDGTGADYLTDELQPDGRRLIKLAYTHYPTAAVPPTKNWVLPTAPYLDYPGPLVLKGETPEPPDPPDPPQPPSEPMPPMPTEWSSHPLAAIEWWTDMCPRLDAVYCNLLTAPGAPLRHADYGGWGNWVFHIREEAWSVDQVVAGIKDSDEYQAIHPHG